METNDKILKAKNIREKCPQTKEIPDGKYAGLWSGYIIELSYAGKIYLLDTEIGTTNKKVIVTITDGISTFTECK